MRGCPVRPLRGIRKRKIWGNFANGFTHAFTGGNLTLVRTIFRGTNRANTAYTHFLNKT